MRDLNAEFNRWSISKHDFEEAHDYLKAFNPSMDGTIQRALLSAAIIAYGRPFKRNDKNPKADRYIELPANLLDTAGHQLHTKIIELRDRGIAHSDFDLKPTSRVQRNDVGVMTWSKIFNPLSAGISVAKFQEMSWLLSMHCINEMSRLNSQLNGAGPSSQSIPVPEDASLELRFKLSDFRSE